MFARMAAGRNFSSIKWLTSTLSFDLLMNMATNPLVPYKFAAAVIELILALYVDRYPQVGFKKYCFPHILQNLTNPPGLNFSRPQWALGLGRTSCGYWRSPSPWTPACP